MMRLNLLRGKKYPARKIAGGTAISKSGVIRMQMKDQKPSGTEPDAGFLLAEDVAQPLGGTKGQVGVLKEIFKAGQRG